MSHFTSVKTKLDVHSLMGIAKQLGLEVIQNSTVQGFAGRVVAADLVVKQEGVYDLGFYQVPGQYLACIGHMTDGHLEGASKLLEKILARKVVNSLLQQNVVTQEAQVKVNVSA